MTPEERATDILYRCWWRPEREGIDGSPRPEFKGLDVEITNAIRTSVEDAQSKLKTYCTFCGHEEPIDGDGSLITEHITTCEKHPISAILAENKRLRWRLNHQTDDDIEACRQGNHPPDCGK